MSEGGQLPERRNVSGQRKHRLLQHTTRSDEIFHLDLRQDSPNVRYKQTNPIAQVAQVPSSHSNGALTRLLPLAILTRCSRRRRCCVRAVVDDVVFMLVNDVGVVVSKERETRRGTSETRSTSFNDRRACFLLIERRS